MIQNTPPKKTSLQGNLLELGNWYISSSEALKLGLADQIEDYDHHTISSMRTQSYWKKQPLRPRTKKL
ncbi:MAG: hypothetical protein HRT44_10875 [Bdellovibrionales bacterium]|nr:hypothetical protein [Bdellovibrionales bacterium]